MRPRIASETADLADYQDSIPGAASPDAFPVTGAPLVKEESERPR